MYREIAIKPRGSMGKILASVNDAIIWKSNTSVRDRSDEFVTNNVNVKKVLESWRMSLFAHEWLDASGNIMSMQTMIERERKKREKVLRELRQNQPFEKAVLGIGLCDNIEIGSGRAVFLTLAAEGYQILPVHVPNACLEEFEDYLA